jgi:DNA (cytosine-5)-methyltransferase 1
VPRLLDLFCGAGGCSVGYHRAGFTDIVGVDIRPQPRYPFAFVQGDALEYVAAHGREFDAIHASPPCQRYSVATKVQGRSGSHPDSVPPCRELLDASGKPWVMENVVGAPLLNAIELCGTMFGLQVFRHRLFESNVFLFQPAHRKHRGTTNSHRWGKHRYDDMSGGYLTVCGGGNCKVATARKAMGIGWMTKAELNQAIPPAYTEFVGKQLLAHLEVSP